VSARRRNRPLLSLRVRSRISFDDEAVANPSDRLDVVRALIVVAEFPAQAVMWRATLLLRIGKLR
jgi:hypothetical protein